MEHSVQLLNKKYDIEKIEISFHVIIAIHLLMEKACHHIPSIHMHKLHMWEVYF